MISTEEGNENSKANPEEVEQAVSRVQRNCWRCRREDVVSGGWYGDCGRKVTLSDETGQRSAGCSSSSGLQRAGRAVPGQRQLCGTVTQSRHGQAPSLPLGQPPGGPLPPAAFPGEQDPILPR